MSPDERSSSTEQPSGGAMRRSALVHYGDRTWTLTEGSLLSAGRQSSCELRMGSAEIGPEDLGVSRRAYTLSHAQGRVWIRNESGSLPVFVRPGQGQDLVLARRGDIVSLAGHTVDIVLEGQIRSYTVTVELPEQTVTDEQPVTVAPATRAALPLSARERRLLAALCEPLLTASGSTRPASYREIAERLSLSDHTVRNALDALRERLITIGIPGMIGADAKDNLARYAVRSGSVTDADLDLLEQSPQ